MIILGVESCGPSLILKTILYAKQLLEILKIVIPIGLILMIILDFSKNVISSKEDEMKKNFNLAIKRLLFGIIIFLIPSVINAVMELLGQSNLDLANCYANVSKNAIVAIEKMEEKQKYIDTYENVKTPEFDKNPPYNYSSSNSSSNSKASGCDGVVYYENGTYYKPSNSEYNGKEKSKGSAEYGYNKYFYEQLEKMKKAANAKGYTFNPSTTEYGAWRPYENQQYFYNCYINQNCNNGNLAAVPGKSNHGWGIASDVNYGGSSASVTWAHEHAAEYGLHYPISSENWHIEPINLQTNDEKVKKCL